MSIQYRAEAAERLSDNREVAIADIIKNSGVQAIAADGYFTTVKDAVDFHLRQLADYLIHGNGATLPGGRTGGKNSSVDPIFAAVGAIAFAYLRNRICAPRDWITDAMSGDKPFGFGGSQSTGTAKTATPSPQSVYANHQ